MFWSPFCILSRYYVFFRLSWTRRRGSGRRSATRFNCYASMSEKCQPSKNRPDQAAPGNGQCGRITELFERFYLRLLFVWWTEVIHSVLWAWLNNFFTQHSDPCRVRELGGVRRLAQRNRSRRCGEGGTCYNSELQHLEAGTPSHS